MNIFMLSIIMLGAAFSYRYAECRKLNVILLGVILNFVMLNMLNVVMLNVVMLSAIC